MESYEGPHILLIDKPKGITSFDVIRRLRRKIGVKKMGHAGTLDPLATGLMLIGVGSGTKQLTSLVGLEKEYEAEIRVGEQRTTGDLEGEVVAEASVSESEAELRSRLVTVLAGICGELVLPVSAYSAIKVDGVPMYKRARKAAKKGERVEDVPARAMHVHEAQLKVLDVTPPRAVATVRFVVGSGTYIRSLAEEIGRRLGYPATLQSLRRTRIGTYHVQDAQQI